MILQNCRYLGSSIASSNLSARKQRTSFSAIKKADKSARNRRVNTARKQRTSPPENGGQARQKTADKLANVSQAG